MRYAIYYTPPPGSALAGFGRAWFARAAPCLDAPRRYGFHGTLKAPFRLAAGVEEAELLGAVESFAASRPALAGPPLEPAMLAGFLALMPSEPCGALDRLAADCVVAFDRFRAPPTDVELARRRRAPLGPRREALLKRWGYPYVMEAFRFHMTLTGRLDEEELRKECALAAGMLGEAALPLVVDAVTVLAEPAEGAAFRILRRCEFAGPAGLPRAASAI